MPSPASASTAAAAPPPARAAARSLARFRRVAVWEGVSYLLLLFAAMPLKYLAGEPLPVKVVGWAHGLLFIAYVALLCPAAWRLRWRPTKSGAAFLAALVPFATFWLERKLRREQAAIGRKGPSARSP